VVFASEWGIIVVGGIPFNVESALLPSHDPCFEVQSLFSQLKSLSGQGSGASFLPFAYAQNTWRAYAKHLAA
jgi:hypothetical protein